jgi:hypothetical protein
VIVETADLREYPFSAGLKSVAMAVVHHVPEQILPCRQAGVAREPEARSGSEVNPRSPSESLDFTELQ